jgi:phage-related protein
MSAARVADDPVAHLGDGNPAVGELNTVGRGVREIRIRDAAGIFRVPYVAKFDDAVYGLHCFRKKTQKTSKVDLDLAAQRYRDLLKELRQ